MGRELIETMEATPTVLDQKASGPKRSMPTLAELTGSRCILMFEIENNRSAGMIGVALATSDQRCVNIGGAHQIIRFYEKNFRQGWRVNLPLESSGSFQLR